MTPQSKALKKKGLSKINNEVVVKQSDRKGVTARQPYTFLKQIGAKNDSGENKGEE